MIQNISFVRILSMHKFVLRDLVKAEYNKESFYDTHLKARGGGGISHFKLQNSDFILQ